MVDSAAFLLEQAYASAHVHFIYNLTQQRVTFVNQAYEKMLNGHQAQVEAELPALLARMHPDDASLWHYYWRLWCSGQLQEEVEVRLVTDGQPEQWLCLTPYWQQAENGDVVLGGVLKDISASKRHQDNSDKFNTKKNTVLEILAHDLAGIFAMLQQLSTHIEYELTQPAQPHVAELLQLSGKTSQQGLNLIHDLINRELQASANIDMKVEQLDLVKRIGYILEPINRAPAHQGRLLSFDTPAHAIYVRADANKLMQVVSNLVHNAYKFTPEDRAIRVAIAPCEGCVRISVADEGIGIPAYLLPVLFERYTPARRPGLLGEPTTGLGLWLCKTIVELHNGTLHVESQEGRGTTFTIELPVIT